MRVFKAKVRVVGSCCAAGHSYPHDHHVVFVIQVGGMEFRLCDRHMDQFKREVSEQ